MTNFDHCNIKNWKDYLNSELLPYEDFRCNFTKNEIATLHRAYAEFQNSYYERDNVLPLVNKSNFKKTSTDRGC